MGGTSGGTASWTTIGALIFDASGGAIAGNASYSGGHHAYASYKAASQLQTNSWFLFDPNNITWGNGFTNQFFVTIQCAFPNTNNHCQQQVGLAHCNNSASSQLNASAVLTGSWFFCDSNAANWLFYNCDGSTTTNVNTGIPLSTNWTSFSISMDEARAACYGYINGVLVATNTARLPTAGAYLNIYGGQQCTNTAHTTEIDASFIYGQFNNN